MWTDIEYSGGESLDVRDQSQNCWPTTPAVWKGWRRVRKVGAYDVPAQHGEDGKSRCGLLRRHRD